MEPRKERRAEKERPEGVGRKIISNNNQSLSPPSSQAVFFNFTSIHFKQVPFDNSSNDLLQLLQRKVCLPFLACSKMFINISLCFKSNILICWVDYDWKRREGFFRHIFKLLHKLPMENTVKEKFVILLKIVFCFKIQVQWPSFNFAKKEFKRLE